jgi:glutamate--cysteine ligase catalytic subunit
MVFTGMIVNVLTFFDVDFVLPISLVDQNMNHAMKRNALFDLKFWWKTHAVKRDSKGRPLKSNVSSFDFLKNQTLSQLKDQSDDAKHYKQITIAQLLLGDSSLGVDSLIELIKAYMHAKKWSEQHFNSISKYLDFMVARATGLLPTDAQFLRRFVKDHPKYNHDSILSDEINFDIATMIALINDPESKHRQLLLGKFA